jgi:hypothetical protein
MYLACSRIFSGLLMGVRDSVRDSFGEDPRSS